jgi:hypothetical protein
MSAAPIVTESWRLLDRWWSDERIEIEYVVASWNGRPIVFRRTQPDAVWRIVR